MSWLVVGLFSMNARTSPFGCQDDGVIGLRL